MQENKINFITNWKKKQTTTFWSGVLALLYRLQKPNFKSQLFLMMEMTLLKSPAPKHVFVCGAMEQPWAGPDSTRGYVQLLGLP